MRVLGLDIGVTSVGWAVVEADNEEKEKNKIIRCGVRLFDSVAANKDDKLESKIRAESKSSRKRFKRKKERLNKIIEEFIKIDFLENIL